MTAESTWLQLSLQIEVFSQIQVQICIVISSQQNEQRVCKYEHKMPQKSAGFNAVTAVPSGNAAVKVSKNQRPFKLFLSASTSPQRNEEPARFVKHAKASVSRSVVSF